ncbi:unnamed protein product [Phaedon cochleariae]|uniref:pH-sensitive chloride channel 2 n=1 Tax=Phaedon cochleariae TaxID=80249 RepID=A0A9P0D8F2_PHACE|nr:unnamed protein product [Phaedon cochleariae]
MIMQMTFSVKKCLVLCSAVVLFAACEDIRQSDVASTSSIMNIPSSTLSSQETSIQKIKVTEPAETHISTPTSLPMTNQTIDITEKTIATTSISSTTTAATTSAIPSTTSTTSEPTTMLSTSTVTADTPKPFIDDDKCPDMSLDPDLDILTQDDFSSKLTDSCRYDRLTKPPSSLPLEVVFQFDMTHIESADHLQLKAHIIVQLFYTDRRLNYTKLSPTRSNIVGEITLREKIWVPHLIIMNERESGMMGLDGKDVLVQISPNGNVIYSYRMSTMFYCWMNLQKFPFDHQICEITWVSWAYNVSNLVLQWEKNKPFQVATNLHLTEFVLEEKWCETSVVLPSFERGGLAGNYSAVVFKFKLRREVGYYIMDYFLPSILLVMTSWVTFWLQADAAAPRVTLGTATMLSFITLNGGLTKNLPKVSYIKASEIWFLTCASFIFFSLAEFAFVNVIWRRRKKVELKKQNSKHILKGALTPSLARKQLRKAESMNTLYKTRSCSSLDKHVANNIQSNYLTVHSFSTLTVPKITAQSQDELIENDFDSVTTIPIPDGRHDSSPPTPTWTTMTPQEVAMWIDKKSRVVFPVSFLVFNLFYWSFLYAI